MKYKLVELTDTPWEPRWKALSEVLKSDLDIDFSGEVRSCTKEQLKENLEILIKSDADICRISDSMSALVPNLISQKTHKALFSGASPFLIREKGQWWPRPLVDEAFSVCLAENLEKLDLMAFALVAGAGGAAKLVISSLATTGFLTINVTDKDPLEAEKLVEEMRKKFFQVQFNAIPFQAITTLPGVHSLVINTSPLQLENDLLDELYFFNFLKGGGAVIDLTLVPAETPLIMEAKQWGARHLSGDYVAAHQDALMIEKLTGKKISSVRYREALRKLVDAAPFDTGPFLQRFRERGS